MTELNPELKEKKKKRRLKSMLEKETHQSCWTINSSTFDQVLNLIQKTTLGDFCDLKNFSLYFFCCYSTKKECGLKERKNRLTISNPVFASSKDRLQKKKKKSLMVADGI